MGLKLGRTFTLSATARNDGEGAAAATMLRYYQVDGRDDHDGHVAGDGRHCGACRIGDQHLIGGSGGTDEPWHVLLWGVRGRGDG